MNPRCDWLENAPIRQKAYERFKELRISDSDIDRIMLSSTSFVTESFWQGKALMITWDTPTGPLTRFRILQT